MPLPKLDCGIAIFLMWAWTKRERKGADFCRDRIIGPIRGMARTPPVTVDLCGSSPTSVVLAEAREVLTLHCRACGACELKDAPP